MGTGIDLVLPDGRRVIDESILESYKVNAIKYVHWGFIPSGGCKFKIYHKLKDNSWLCEFAEIWGGKITDHEIDIVDEGEVRKVMIQCPEYFATAFGEPRVVS